MKRKQLITLDEAVTAKVQHTKPCSDCPWARVSLPGWLGGETVDAWIAEAHSDNKIPCHTLNGAQCAGSSIYRRNVCKTPRDASVLRLEADRELVFATPSEFREHHERRGRSPAGPESVAAEGTPRQRESGDSGMANDVKAKTDELKAKHAKAVDGLKAGHEKKLVAAQEKGKRETAKVVETVQKVDGVLTSIAEVIDSTDPKLTDAKKVAKVKALVEKGTKLCDKHLA